MLQIAAMKSLIHYSSIYALRESRHLPGVERFSAYFKMYSNGVVPADRTGTIRFPFRTASLFPMPEFRPQPKTYREICDERARELLSRAEKLDVTLYAFWSGGIDSTLVVASLLKNATPEQRENIVVLLSEDSIAEYPLFYEKFIRGNLRRESSSIFPYLLGSKHLFVNGEHNDQLFGSDIVAQFIARCGAEHIHKPFNPDLFTSFYGEKLSDMETARFYVGMFERLKAAAPMPLESNYDMFWWINFAVKWQTVYTRTLAYTARRNRDKITKEYTSTYYEPFYNTEDFQLWSMNNLDKKIKDSWTTYKWTAKDAIYEITKDADYRDNKKKLGSLQFLILQHVIANYIDDSFRYYDKLDPSEFYDPANDFI